MREVKQQQMKKRTHTWEEQMREWVNEIALEPI